MENKKKFPGQIITIVITILSSALLVLAYNYYEKSPSTRHAVVKADIIKITPEINGKVTRVYIKDNQSVKKGDLLFEIDPAPFVIAKKAAEIALEKAYQDVEALKKMITASKASVKAAEAAYKDTLKNKKRSRALFKSKSISEKKLEDAIRYSKEARSRLEAAKASLQEKILRLGKPDQGNIAVEAAKIKLEKAALYLSYTKIYSPADGSIVNISINPGSFAVAGHPVLAVVDSSSIHVMAALKETQLKSVKAGDKAVIKFMTESGKETKGFVESIGSAINPMEYRSSDSIVPTIPAAFDWVRLAQRVPVKIDFESDKGFKPIPGTTASVQIQPTEKI